MAKKSSKKKPAPARKPAKASAKKPARKSAPKKAPGRTAARKPASVTAPVVRSTANRERALGLLSFARAQAEKFINSLQGEQCCAQPFAGANHALWSLGHLTCTHDWLAGLIDGQPSALPSDYNALFNMGSQPQNDASKYPSWESVQRAYQGAFDRLYAAVGTLSDDQLAQPCAGETYGFATDKLDALHKGAWHMGWHSGQVADVRRAMGMPGLYGS